MLSQGERESCQEKQCGKESHDAKEEENDPDSQILPLQYVSDLSHPRFKGPVIGFQQNDRGKEEEKEKELDSDKKTDTEIMPHDQQVTYGSENIRTA